MADLVIPMRVIATAIRECRAQGVEPVRIRAFAAPYAVSNSYGETFAPRAMRGKLFAPKLMLMNHDAEHFPIAGAWLDIAENDEGVWSEGVVTDARVAANIDRAMAEFPEISVAWTGGGRQYSRAARARDGFPPLLVEPHITEGLAEISLVDKGSFPGTRWWRL
jgi:hypothetical protein